MKEVISLAHRYLELIFVRWQKKNKSLWNEPPQIGIDLLLAIIKLVIMCAILWILWTCVTKKWGTQGFVSYVIVLLNLKKYYAHIN